MVNSPLARLLWVFPIVLLVPSLILNVVLLNRNKSIALGGVKVIGVIDGDTIVLEGKSRVRLRYVDAPEVGLCGYDQAKVTLEKLVNGTSVRIEETIPDQYGRGMALAYVGDTLVNKEMIASGWVRYHSDQSSQTDAIKAASAQAQAEKIGIYGLCHSMENTKNPKCTIKANIDLNNSKRRRYYLPDCAQYKFTVVEEERGEAWFCSEKEAQKAGFTKAETCK
jgi:endonuclease YncB( thermonuclease family)